eukprot:3133866-Pyramimonas_sp.AAC.1
MQVLQHRDTTGKVLLDLAVFADKMNPLHVCHLELSDFLREKLGGRLAPIISYYDGDERSAVILEARIMAIAFTSSAWWRFYPYRCF